MNVRINNAPHALRPLAVAVKKVTIAGTAGTLEGLGSFTFDAACEYVQVAIGTGPVNTDPSGTAPDSTTGQPVLVGQIVLLSIGEAKLGKWIRTTATSGVAQVSQYTLGN